MKKKKFSEEIIVTRIEDGDDSYLNATETLDGLEHGDVVAVYKLHHIRKVIVTTELV